MNTKGYEKEVKCIILDIIVQWTNEKYPEQAKSMSLQEANVFVDKFYAKNFLSNRNKNDSV